MDFKGKVAVITGAGGGLGRAYAIALGKLGAKVVVNDLGVATDGSAAGEKNADVVVKEIKEAGGEAVANYDSVEFGDKIIQTAIDNFGTVHILINNAGILRDVSFRKMTDTDWDLISLVHLKGAYKCAKAAWPHMEKQSYGKILNIASAAGLYGNFGQVNYSTAKNGLIGFTKSLALEGKKRQISVNVIAPLAASRMTESLMPPNVLEMLKPEYVSPLALYLCHEKCEASGDVFETGAGWFAQVRLQRSKGVLMPKPPTIEGCASVFDKACDFEEDATFPSQLMESMQAAVEAISSAEEAAPAAAAPAAKPAAAAADSGATSNLKVAKFFKFATVFFETKGGPIIGHTYHFDITEKKGQKKPAGSWTINLKDGKGSVSAGKQGKADATFIMTDADAVDVMLGRANPQMAFLQGKMKIQGSMPAATKFTPDLFPSITEADLDKDPMEVLNALKAASKL